MIDHEELYYTESELFEMLHKTARNEREAAARVADYYALFAVEEDQREAFKACAKRIRKGWKP